MTKIPDPEKPLNPTVIKLGLVSFFADVASEMLYPLTPIFLTTVLGASMASVGFIEGTAEAIASLLKTFSGAWSDSLRRRKPFVLVGYGLAAISKPGIGLATGWTGVLAARALDRTGKGLRSAPRDAMLSEAVSEKHRGAAFGWHRAMDTLGAFLGPLIAVLFLTQNPEDMRRLFFWAAVPGLLSVLLVMSLREKEQSPAPAHWTNPFRAWKKLSGSFRGYVYAWGVFSLANSSDVFLLMKAKSVGFTTVSVLYLYCAYNLVYAASSPWLGGLSDRMDRRKILAAGLFVFALVYLGFSAAFETWHFWALFMLYGIYMGATDGVGKALAVDLCPKDMKATAVGILGTVTGVCTIAASSVAGVLWDRLGPGWTFYFGAAGALVASAMLIAVTARRANAH